MSREIDKRDCEHGWSDTESDEKLKRVIDGWRKNEFLCELARRFAASYVTAYVGDRSVDYRLKQNGLAVGDYWLMIANEVQEHFKKEGVLCLESYRRKYKE